MKRLAFVRVARRGWRPESGVGAALGHGVAIAAVALAASLVGCRHKHVPVPSEPELGYPACDSPRDAGPADPGIVVAEGHVRSGPFSVERYVSERFDLRRTACGYTFRTRQEWPLAVSDVEVRYDADLRPIWAWKRMTIPGSTREDGNADYRRYELRTATVFIKRRDDKGRTTLEELLPGGRVAPEPGARVGAVVGPGRGILTPWIRRAHLAVGAKRHDLVLDFRASVETLEVAALEREPDRFEPSLGTTVRVYTFYGRETVFADANDVVVGDLAGMRPSDSLDTPEPPPLPMYGAPDPRHTP